MFTFFWVEILKVDSAWPPLLLYTSFRRTADYKLSRASSACFPPAAFFTQMNRRQILRFLGYILCSLYGATWFSIKGTAELTWQGIYSSHDFCLNAPTDISLLKRRGSRVVCFATPPRHRFVANPSYSVRHQNMFRNTTSAQICRQPFIQCTSPKYVTSKHEERPDF